MDKVLVRNEDEAPVVEKVFDLFVNERLGAASIRKKLNESGYRTRSGRNWSTKTIRDMLGSYAYIGLVTHYDEIHPGQHEPLIDRALWDEAQQLSEQRGDSSARKRVQSVYLFSGLLSCGKCGGALSGQTAHGRSGRYRYYVCLNRVARGTVECDLERLDAEDADRSLVTALVDTLSDTDLFLDAARHWLAERDRQRPMLEAELAGAHQQLTSVKEALERWYSAVEHGSVAEDMIGERLEALITQRGQLRRRIEDLEGQLAASASDLPTEADITDYATKVADALADQVVTPAKKALLATLVDHVTVQPGRELHPCFKVPGTMVVLGEARP